MGVYQSNRSINMAAENGADAAKFQNFIAETIVSDYGFKRLNSISVINHLGKNQFLKFIKMHQFH